MTCCDSRRNLSNDDVDDDCDYDCGGVCVPVCMCVCVCGTLGRDLDSMAHYLNDAGLAVKSHQ